MRAPQGWRPFNDNSPWNTRIPGRPAVDARSGQMIQDLFLVNSYPTQPAGKLGVCVKNWSIPVYVVDDKKVKGSKINYSMFHKFCHPQNLFTHAPVTPKILPDRQGDAHLCVVNKSLTKAWDFWSLKRIKGQWVARSGREVDLTGMGVQQPGSGGCRAAGFPLIAGLIRPDEIARGRIDHALVFAYATPKHGAYVYPATLSDGMSVRPGAIPEGARLQLDPNLDLDRLHLKPAAKVIARALQEYGMYLGDGSGGFCIYAEVFPGRKDQWQGVLGPFDLFDIPTERFRVLKLPKLQREGIPLDWPTTKDLEKDPGFFGRYN